MAIEEVFDANLKIGEHFAVRGPPSRRFHPEAFRVFENFFFIELRLGLFLNRVFSPFIPLTSFLFGWVRLIRLFPLEIPFSLFVVLFSALPAKPEDFFRA